MSVPSYVNRATFKHAADIATTPISDVMVDRVLDEASRSIERLCSGRKFYPTTETRYRDWPDQARSNSSWKLFLDDDELISLTSLTAGTTAITNYNLEPSTGPPYRWIEIDLTSSDTFSSGTSTHQRAITMVGVFGHSADTTAAGQLNGALSDTTTTTVNVTDGSRLDAGDAIQIESEWMVVTDSGWVDSTDNLTGDVAADVADTVIAVTDGTTWTKGEVVLVDTERMFIVDIAGNNLTVRRRWDGTPVAAHTTGADIYVRRSLTVERGALGSTAATHADTTAVARLVPPAAVQTLTIAEAQTTLAQERADYARTIGAGENEREARGSALIEYRRRVRTQYGQRAQHHALGGR